MERFSGRRVLVTGGSRGIGWAIAERFRREGAQVLVTGTRMNGKAPEGCAYMAVDFGDAVATERLCSEIRQQPLDILINNAGINKISPFAAIDPEDFDRIQRVNVRAPFLLSRAAIPGMMARRWGRIVTISSIWGKISRAERGSYSTSKFAVDGMIAALAAEVAQHGILVNCVAPGFIETDLTRRTLGEDGMKALRAQIPVGRLGQPMEIATFVCWLASPENTYISGQNIAVDGGFTRV